MIARDSNCSSVRQRRAEICSPTNAPLYFAEPCASLRPYSLLLYLVGLLGLHRRKRNRQHKLRLHGLIGDITILYYTCNEHWRQGPRRMG